MIMIYRISLSIINLLQLNVQLSIVIIFIQTYHFSFCFFEMVAFAQLVEVKLQFQQEKLLALARDAVLDELEDTVEVAETTREIILLEFLRYENFKTLLKLNDEQLFGYSDSLKYSFYQKYARKCPNTLHEFQFCVLHMQIIPFKFEL